MTNRETTHDKSQLRPKVHPASREALPDDPLELHATEVPGDPEVMFQVLVEEFARVGYGVDSILALARDPFYSAFHALLRRLGEGEFRKRVEESIAATGVVRVRFVENHGLNPARG